MKKIIGFLVFSFMYLVLVDAMTRSKGTLKIAEFPNKILNFGSLCLEGGLEVESFLPIEALELGRLSSPPPFICKPQVVNIFGNHVRLISYLTRIKVRNCRKTLFTFELTLHYCFGKMS